MLLNISPRPISPNKPFISVSTVTSLPSGPFIVSPFLAPNNAVEISKLVIFLINSLTASTIFWNPSVNFLMPPPVTKPLIAETKSGIALLLSVVAKPSPASCIALNISFIALPTVGSLNIPEII